MEFGLAAFITAVIAGGVFGALARAWSFRRDLLAFDDRLNLVEGIVSREVKVRAADARWRKPSKDEEFIAKVLENQPPAQAVNDPWWVKAAKAHPRSAGE